MRERSPDGRLLQGDVVGDLVGLDARTAVIATRTGLVEVPVTLVTLARLAPPSTAEELALEDIVARGWRAAETGRVGGWVLRASGGFTGRGNSVLPLRSPGMPLDDAVAAAGAWYAERDLPLLLQVPVEARRLLDAELGERGWPTRGPDVHVLTSRLDVVRAPESGVGVDIADRPDDAWLRLYRAGAATGPDAYGLLTRHDRVAFASIRDGGVTVAIGRGTVDDGWLGVTAVEVTPTRRRRGLADSVMRGLWTWGVGHGAVRSHVEVASDNGAGVALYESQGYRIHHDYRYRTAPQMTLRTHVPRPGG